MLTTLMLDLGDTLVTHGEALPFVQESLAALGSFQIQDGAPLATCLVSDFHLAHPFSPQKVNELAGDYQQLLAQFGLAAFFEPFHERVTLSTHANRFKPDRRVFELALQRLGSSCSLDECLFITENETHIAACRGFGMETLTFGADDPEEGFDDWSDGIMLIANRFAANNRSNLQAAFPVWAKEHLKCAHVKDVDVTPSGLLTATGQCWIPVTGTADTGLEGINVPAPAKIEATLGKFGLPQEVRVTEADQEMLIEARAFIDSLSTHDQITDKPDEATPEQTHIVEEDDDGTKFLRRRGFN